MKCQYQLMCRDSSPKAAKLRRVIAASSFLGLFCFGPTLLAVDTESLAKARQQYGEQAKAVGEKYAGDDKKILAELDRLQREYAKAIGQERLLEKLKQDSQRLFAKYYPLGRVRTFSLVTDVGGGRLRNFDMAAWQQTLRVSDNEVTLTFFLDRERYKGVSPISPTVQLRTKGKGDKEEYLLSEGQNPVGTFRAQLATTRDPDGVYSTKFTMSAATKDLLLVQIDAEIEPGWYVRALVELNSLEFPSESGK